MNRKLKNFLKGFNRISEGMMRIYNPQTINHEIRPYSYYQKKAWQDIGAAWDMIGQTIGDVCENINKASETK